MANVSEILNQFIEETIKKIVDEPNEVKVTCSVSTKAIIIQIKAAQSDIGKIIGKAGRSIEACKILCMAIKNTNSPDDARRVILEVLEDENSSFTFNK